MFSHARSIRLSLLTVTFACILPAAAANAADADASPTVVDPAVLMQRMKSALEPPRDNIRDIEITIRGPLQVESRWYARQARQHRDGRSRLALVITAPPELRGVALLFDETRDAPGVEYHYLPVTRRVRKLKPVGRFQPFVGTDFTYSDLGLLPLRDRTFRSAEPTVLDGTPVHRVTEIPTDNYYYGKIVDWIAMDSRLPVRRDFYAPSGLLWKQEHFEEIVEIGGVPTPMRVRMVDVLEDESSEIETKSVRFVPVPDDVFDPGKLSDLIDNPVWESGEGVSSADSRAPGRGDEPTH